MKSIGTLVVALVTLSGAAVADPAANQAGGMKKLSQAECTNLWHKANPDNAAGVTESQAAPYVSNFKAANPDGDTTIDSKEWVAACNAGLVKSSASTGGSSGSSGSAQ